MREFIRAEYVTIFRSTKYIVHLKDDVREHVVSYTFLTCDEADRRNEFRKILK